MPKRICIEVDDSELRKILDLAEGKLEEFVREALRHYIEEVESERRVIEAIDEIFS